MEGHSELNKLARELTKLSQILRDIESNGAGLSESEKKTIRRLSSKTGNHALLLVKLYERNRNIPKKRIKHLVDDTIQLIHKIAVYILPFIT